MFAAEQFHVRVLHGRRVTSQSVKSMLATFAGMRPEVLAVVFCGHVRQRGASAAAARHGQPNPHGTMRLCGITTWSSEDTSRLLSRCSFTGTLITFLNMCHAGPQQPVAAGDTEPCGSWASHGQPPGLLSGRQPMFSSSSRDAEQPVSHASPVLRSFIGARGVSYASLRSEWPTPALGYEAFCSMGGDYGGVFPGPAL